MTLTELLSKLTEEDKKYLQQNAKNEKDFYDYFVTKGLTDSYEEFTAILDQVKKLSSGEKELSDDELEKVAGGYNGYEIQSMYNDYVNSLPKGGITILDDGSTSYTLPATPMPIEMWIALNGIMW